VTVLNGQIHVGGSPAPGRIIIRLVVPNEDGSVGFEPSAQEVGEKIIRSDATGAWSIDLVSNEVLSPPNTYYSVRMEISGRRSAAVYVRVPVDGPVNLSDLPIHVLSLVPLPGGGSGVALGETASTAYRGDRGKQAYDHSQATGNPHSTTAAQVGAEAIGVAAGLVNAEALLARNADNLQNGTVPDPRIPATITRDTELTAAVSAEQVRADAYADAAIAALIAAAPSLLNTLDEIAQALNDDPNFAATMTTALAGKQPLDAELTAIASVASAANKLPYFTGSGAASVTDFTAFIRTLMDDADATAARSTLNAETAGAAAAVVSTAPVNLNTLAKIATAIGNDPAFAATVTAAMTAMNDDITTLETDFAAMPTLVQGSNTTLTPVGDTLVVAEANVPTSTIKGRASAGTGVVESLVNAYLVDTVLSVDSLVTPTSFTTVAYRPGQVASGNVPANWIATGAPVDVAGIQFIFGLAGFTGTEIVKVLVPNQGIFHTTPDAVGSAWEFIPALTAVTPTGHYYLCQPSKTVPLMKVQDDYRFVEKQVDDAARLVSTPLPDSELLTGLPIDSKWILEGMLIYQNGIAGAPGGFRVSFVVPAAASFKIHAHGPDPATTASASAGGRIGVATSATSISFGGAAATDLAIPVRGTITMGGTAGNFGVSWGTQATGPIATGSFMRLGSYVELRRAW
jgi:hypothetical protein